MPIWRILYGAAVEAVNIAWSFTALPGKNGDVLVRFYTDRFELCNDTSEFTRYALQYQRHPSLPRSIKLNGAPVESGAWAGGVLGRIELEGGRSAKVEISRERDPTREGISAPTLAWRAKVLFRRHLSEFRDNYVDKSRFLLRRAARAGRPLARSE